MLGDTVGEIMGIQAGKVVDVIGVTKKVGKSFDNGSTAKILTDGISEKQILTLISGVTDLAGGEVDDRFNK